VNSYTEKQDFNGASLVPSDLGEPSKPFTVLSGIAHSNKLVEVKILNNISPQ